MAQVTGPLVGTQEQVRDGGTTLDAAIRLALSDLGDSEPAASNADVYLRGMHFANRIVDDILGHPYWKPGTPLNYYTSVDQAQDAIPDNILITGLLYHFARSIGSQKKNECKADYQQALNTLLYRKRFGIAPELNIAVPDKVGGGLQEV